MNKLKKIAPELSKMKKEKPFRVPDNYFDDFSARLATRIKADRDFLPQPQNRVIKFLKPALGLAASFALIFMLVYWPLNSFLPNYLSGTETYIETSTGDVTIFSVIENIDENSFFALLNESLVAEEEIYDEFNDEELLNYLSANVSDYEIYLQTEN